MSLMSLIDAAMDKVPVPLRCACGCNTGKRRPKNEDNFSFDGKYLRDPNNVRSLGDEVLTMRVGGLDWETGFPRLFGVFDGMGGGDYGEVASEKAAHIVHDWLVDRDKIADDELDGVENSLAALCLLINQEVYHTAFNLGSEQMGSTLAMLYFLSGYVWTVNLGDSRVFRVRNGNMRQLSVDHTDEEEMRAVGIVDRKPMLTQYLGINPEVFNLEPSVSRRTVKRGDVYLVCSDGLTDMVQEDRICEILDEGKSPEECVRKLIRSALEAGGRDNITTLVIFAG